MAQPARSESLLLYTSVVSVDDMTTCQARGAQQHTACPPQQPQAHTRNKSKTLELVTQMAIDF